MNNNQIINQSFTIGPEQNDYTDASQNTILKRNIDQNDKNKQFPNESNQFENKSNKFNKRPEPTSDPYQINYGSPNIPFYNVPHVYQEMIPNFQPTMEQMQMYYYQQQQMYLQQYYNQMNQMQMSQIYNNQDPNYPNYNSNN